MKSDFPRSTPPDHDSDLDDDAVWSLLDKGSPFETSPTFLQDTLRRARLEGGELPWWKKFTAGRIWAASFATAGSAAALIVLILSLNSEPTAPVDLVKNTTFPPSQWSEELDDALASELLSDAAEDPSLLSDQELVALLY